jgi:hypothetical protein
MPTSKSSAPRRATWRRRASSRADGGEDTTNSAPRRASSSWDGAYERCTAANAIAHRTHPRARTRMGSTAAASDNACSTFITFFDYMLLHSATQIGAWSGVSCHSRIYMHPTASDFYGPCGSRRRPAGPCRAKPSPPGRRRRLPRRRPRCGGADGRLPADWFRRVRRLERRAGRVGAVVARGAVRGGGARAPLGRRARARSTAGWR